MHGCVNVCATIRVDNAELKTDWTRVGIFTAETGFPFPHPFFIQHASAAAARALSDKRG